MSREAHETRYVACQIFVSVTPQCRQCSLLQPMGKYLRLVRFVSDRSVAKLSLQTVIMAEASSVDLRFLTCVKVVVDGRKCFWERTAKGRQRVLGV